MMFGLKTESFGIKELIVTKENIIRIKEAFVTGLQELKKLKKVDLEFTEGYLTDFHCYKIGCKNCPLKEPCIGFDPNRESYEKFLKKLKKLKIKKEELS